MTDDELRDRAAVAVLPLAVQMSVRPGLAAGNGQQGAMVDGGNAGKLAYLLAEELVKARRGVAPPPEPQGKVLGI